MQSFYATDTLRAPFQASSKVSADCLLVMDDSLVLTKGSSELDIAAFGLPKGISLSAFSRITGNYFRLDLDCAGNCFATAKSLLHGGKPWDDEKHVMKAATDRYKERKTEPRPTPAQVRSERLAARKAIRVATSFATKVAVTRATGSHTAGRAAGYAVGRKVEKAVKAIQSMPEKHPRKYKEDYEREARKRAK